MPSPSELKDQRPSLKCVSTDVGIQSSDIIAGSDLQPPKDTEEDIEDITSCSSNLKLH